MLSIPGRLREGAPNPDGAERLAERALDSMRSAGFSTERLNERALTILTLACQRAPYLARLIIRDGTRLARVAADSHHELAKPAAQMRSELTALVASCPTGDSDRLDSLLRRFRGDEMLRLGARELALGDRAAVGAELAHLADVCFDAAIAFHDAALQERFGPPMYATEDGRGDRRATVAVIGMGKLGGEELNFASDVDVIYVYSSDAPPIVETCTISLHEYFSKLCERVTASIGRNTDADVVFRVDLRLRPEGSRGAIANSLASTERYYETWGRPWERQAWLKARPCAGSISLGDEIMKTLEPFIYPRSTGANVVKEVAELNRRIKSELDVEGIERGFDLKNGVGGIREIEFFVQAHQLIHGGRRPTLRSRGTLIALDQLLFAGLISDEEHLALSSAYRYLRHAEHLLQLQDGRQTQRLPTDERPLHYLALRLGHKNTDDFLDTLAERTAAVSALFATLGDSGDDVPSQITVLLGGALTPDRESAVLNELGCADGQRAQILLERLRNKPLSPFHSAASGAASKVAPTLLAAMCASPDPDQALGYLSELVGRRGSSSALWGLLAENPLLAQLISSLFGTSEFLSKAFIRQPHLIDTLLQTGCAQAMAKESELRRRLMERIGKLDSDDIEERWNQLAEFKQAEVLRVGLADVGGVLRPEQVARELSIIAELVLDVALQLVCESMHSRHGVARRADGSVAALAIIGMGKLGARELGYASDLDIIFVYTGDGASDGPRPLDNVAYMTRVAQRLVSGLHVLHPGGRLYEIDTRLRPSGSKGLLVSSLTGWERYHRGQAQLWERQALIKQRAVAGNAELGAAVGKSAAHYVYGSAPGQNDSPTQRELSASISKMRDRMERERADRHTLDLKVGRGGIVDVEFAAQYLQLVWGHDHRLLRCQGTVAALTAAEQCGVLDRNTRDLLVDGYRFLRRIENRLRIVHDRSVHRLPPPGPDLDVLARRAGFAEGAALELECGRWMRAVRDAYRRVLDVSEFGHSG